MALKKSKKDVQNTGTAFEEVLRECHHFLVWFCPSAPIWDLGHLPMGEADVEELHDLSPAQARAPLLMILFSPTCHIYLACITITLRFFLSTFQAVTICHCFFLRGGLLKEEKPQGAPSQIFQEQKKLCRRWSLISLAPS